MDASVWDFRFFWERCLPALDEVEDDAPLNWSLDFLTAAKSIEEGKEREGEERKESERGNRRAVRPRL